MNPSVSENNNKANQLATGYSHLTELAFLHLGDILREIAVSIVVDAPEEEPTATFSPERVVSVRYMGPEAGPRLRNRSG